MIWTQFSEISVRFSYIVKWDLADANGERGRLILIVDCLGPTQERIYSPSQSLLQDITFCSTLESWYQTVFSIFTFCILPSCSEIGEIASFKSSQERSTTKLFIMLNSIYVSNINPVCL